MTPKDRQAAEQWRIYREGIKKSTAIDFTETAEQKRIRIAKLEANPQAWKQYYFGKFFGSASPAFHLAASKRLLKNFIENKHYYEVRHWARGLSKTTTTMMDVFYLLLAKNALKNIIYTSSTYDASERFLLKYQCQFDSNQRIINDYGEQKQHGSWSAGNFITKKGVQFLALGAGQSPRGNGNEEIRPDCIIVDDFDTDEECQNEEIIDKKWNWFESALFFTVDTAKPYLIIWLGNIIAEDCCVVRAGKMADYCETINIRENGVSVWIEKNSEEDIDYQISKVSYESSQRELFNNPLTAGKTFKEITWGKCPNLAQLPFVLSYADPATSNKDKPVGKKKAQNSMKAVVLLGWQNGKFYLYTGYCDNCNNSQFIDWLFAVRDYGKRSPVAYHYIENNSLQDPMWEQVLKPLIYEKSKTAGGISITPDGEKKGEKWYRIEADLEPLVRLGTLVFNIDEKDNPHMLRIASQFLTAKPNTRELGGPDAVQGAVSKVKEKVSIQSFGALHYGNNKANFKRY